jgi:hypothetical protein
MEERSALILTSAKGFFVNGQSTEQAATAAARIALSLVTEDIAAGRLARVGNVAAEVPIGIRLFRPKARLSPAAETFWKQAVSASSERARLGKALVCFKSAIDENFHLNLLKVASITSASPIYPASAAKQPGLSSTSLAIPEASRKSLRANMHDKYEMTRTTHWNYDISMPIYGMSPT